MSGPNLLTVVQTLVSESYRGRFAPLASNLIERAQRVPSEDRLGFFLEEIQRAWGASAIDLFVSDLRADDFVMYDVKNRRFDSNHPIGTLGKTIISAGRKYDRTEKRDHYFPIVKYSQRALGLVHIISENYHSLESSIPQYTDLIIALLSYEIEQLIGSVITNTLDIDINYFQSFEQFLTSLYAKLRASLPYKIIGLYKLAEEGFVRYGDSPLALELRQGNQFFEHVFRSVADKVVGVHSHFPRRGTLDPRVSSGTRIVSAVIVPVERRLFSGAIVLCTGFPHYVSDTEVRSLQVIGTQFGQLVDTFEVLADKNRRRMIEAKQTALEQVDRLAQSARHQVRAHIATAEATTANLKTAVRQVGVMTPEIQNKFDLLTGVWRKMNDSLDQMANATQLRDPDPEVISFSAIIREAFAPEAARAELEAVHLHEEFRDFDIRCYRLFLEHSFFHLFQNSIDTFSRRKDALKRDFVRSHRGDGRGTLRFARRGTDALGTGSDWPNASHFPPRAPAVRYGRAA